MEPVRELARSMVGAKRCCSWGATSATRWRWRARSNSGAGLHHAEGFAARELKHGPIALIDRPAVVSGASRPAAAARQDRVDIQEIRATRRSTIVIAEDGDRGGRAFADVLVRVPSLPTLLQPLVATIPLQVFAAELALRSYDVDQPRTAKSVTVE